MDDILAKPIEERSVKRLAVRWLRHVGAITCTVAALVGGCVGYMRLSGNFHVVQDGVIYRSGQLSGAQFADHIKQSRIKTILNLRGSNSGRQWYDEEITASAAADVKHVDYPISASRELTDQQLREITSLLAVLPKPILIHCEAGADRSGLVSALYQLLINKQTPKEASSQLSLRYGHFPWLGSGTIAMDRTFERVTSTMPAAKD
jgi:protein tyrosine/serine phosphatase